jgi:hypothetical protein
MISFDAIHRGFKKSLYSKYVVASLQNEETSRISVSKHEIRPVFDNKIQHAEDCLQVRGRNFQHLTNVKVNKYFLCSTVQKFYEHPVVLTATELLIVWLNKPQNKIK